ncbi:immunoglobulin superfamily containing leucine-rich repeat protein 2-like [Seriola lalandi dorsalis]|uniref:Immunoglobulin superfamily containing leucine-rich repeat 2 n=1 Tax=Seriola lalandi dorsalis TaxID=1841481 RepID=A0A3B4Z8H8_SERLL|nr:immunoglobulin superfamily containing leucine-rich repeat protein 2-like [Seriola lalandi dorsalis]XP_056243682.1 immunoglobulin superfamily containing leucine-rich repeat protein 2 [Seriola aureovittata]
MARRLLQLLALWTTVIGIVQCCPELCSCQDKFSHQFADCAYKDLLVVPVGLPSNVTTVSLSANKIKLLKSKSFINITQVTSLWLAHNEIITIETDTLAPLIQLRNLDISYNKIVNFPWEDLHNLTALQLLKMNNNEMVNLPKDAFSTLKDLRSLRINNNKFSTIVEGTFSALSSMSHLQIFNNPFTCSCSLEWLREWITTTKISVPEPNSIVCEAPEHLKGTLVTKIPTLDCRAPTVTITYQPNIENTELYEGVMVILNCETKGSPKPQVSWEVIAGNQNDLFPLPSTAEINDAPINDKTTNNRFLVFRNGTLIIPRMSKREDGNYSCSAVNDLGKAESSVRVAMAGTQKHASNSVLDSADGKIHPSAKKPTETKTSKNNVIDWAKPEEKTKGSPEASDKTDRKDPTGSFTKNPTFATKCGVRESSEYISNHAFNMSLEDLKQYTFDFGVIALEVSETEAKVQLNPLQLPSSKSNLHLSQTENQETVNKEPMGLYQSSSGKATLDMVYLCVNTGNGHSVVEWSNIEEGVNAYHFRGLQPGTNYTLCLTYGGQDCQVQVVFTTRKKIPSLLIIVVVSIFLLALATVPLLGATCCHLLYKYQGKTYKLIMKAHNPDQMEKQMAGDFDPRASFVESEKTFNPSELGEGEGEAEGEEGDGEAEGSVVTESIPGSSSKTNQEEFEMGSEYSDRLPLGAEAVNISEEINGNYKQPSR